MAVSNEDFQAFNQYNMQLQNIAQQKTQLKMVIESTKNAIEELEASKEDSAYKNLGFVMLKVEKGKLIKDLKSEIENLEIRIKTMEKTEDLVSKKVKDLQAKFNAEMSAKKSEEKK
jgi:prefoldin beta subunit